MDWPLLLPFVTATLLILITPGPVMAMIVHNTLRNGATAGVLTALGVEAGEVLVLSAVFTGLALSQEITPLLFRWVSFAGTLYLIWLAFRALRGSRLIAQPPARRRSSRSALDGLTIAISNPTTLIFYTAFFPQFIDPHRPLLQQLITLGAVYLAVSLVFDVAFVIAAARLRVVASYRHAGLSRLAELGSATLYIGIATFALINFANPLT